MDVLVSQLDRLFPARAGVILKAIIALASTVSFPRACGGDPMVKPSKNCS